MSADRILFNGELVRWEESGLLEGGDLASRDYVYQKMHVLAYKPLQLRHHLEIIGNTCTSLYGSKPSLNAEMTEQQIYQLTTANHYQPRSIVVILYILPKDEGEFDCLLVCGEQMIYEGYVLWHRAVKAIPYRREIPLPYHKTSALAAISAMAKRDALLGVANEAIICDRDDNALCIGENPLFATFGNTIITPELSDPAKTIGSGAAESVERRMGMEACRQAGFTVEERPIYLEELADCDEIFTITTQGVLSIGEFGGRILTSSIAHRLAAVMRTMQK